MSLFHTRRPAASEHAPYFSRYIDQVPDGDVMALLATQGAASAARFRALSPEQADHAYAPGKWTVRQVIGHLSDAERVFAYRALRFSRADATPLPSFDENLFADQAPHARVPLAALVSELEVVRRATLCLLEQLDEEAWGRAGVASNAPMTVRAAAWTMAGHEIHHGRVLAERYGV